MSHPLTSACVLGCSLLLAARAVADEPTTPATPPASAGPLPSSGPSDAELRASARAWLVALRDRRAAELAKASAFPFFVEGVGATKGPDTHRCRPSAQVKDAAAFVPVAKCLLGDPTLIPSLPSDFALAQWKVIDPKMLPAVFAKRADKVAALKDHALVQVGVNGETTVYTIVLAVRKAAPAVSLVLVDGKPFE